MIPKKSKRQNLQTDEIQNIENLSRLLAVSVQYTAQKVSKYGVFSGPYFPVFGLNAESFGVNLRIQSKCGEMRPEKNSVFGHFPSRGGGSP